MADGSENEQWYTSDLVMEISVSGSMRNVVHRNLVLIRAGSADEAYGKALRLGQEAETSYENPAGQLVQIRFRGVSKLDSMYEELGDGAELTFTEYVGVSPEEIEAWIPPREQLGVFIPPAPGRKHDPDYRSRTVIEMVLDRLKSDEPAGD